MAHALILGASGISGWSLLNQAQEYPSKSAFARITGTTNRPFSLKQAQIPDEERMLLVSGIDFTKTVDDVAAALETKIPDVDTVTHVFFTAYIQTDDFESLREVNTKLLGCAMQAIERVCPKLQVVILQTGGKGYGLEFPKQVGLKAPLHEGLPRIPEPWYNRIFYYTQYDLLKSLSQGKTWTFTEIRPDGIVGHTPASTPMNMAQGIGVYLSIFRQVFGEGAKCPFPGRKHGYDALHTDTFQDLLSRMEIHAALNPEKCGDGGVFNIADGSKPVSWSQVWLGLCKHFGLVGTEPVCGSKTMEEFARENRQVWLELAETHGLDEGLVDRHGWQHTHFMLVDFDFDRQYDLSRARSVGFTEEIDTVDGYIKSWDRMRAARLLPPE